MVEQSDRHEQEVEVVQTENVVESPTNNSENLQGYSELFGTNIAGIAEGSEVAAIDAANQRTEQAGGESLTPTQIIEGSRAAIQEAQALIQNPENALLDSSAVIQTAAELRVHSERIGRAIRQLANLDNQTLGQDGAALLSELSKVMGEVEQTKQSMTKSVTESVDEVRQEFAEAMSSKYGEALREAAESGDEQAVEEIIAQQGEDEVKKGGRIKELLKNTLGIAVAGVGGLVGLVGESDSSAFVNFILYGSSGALGRGPGGKEKAGESTVSKTEFVDLAKNPRRMAEVLLKAYDDTLKNEYWSLSPEQVSALQQAVNQENPELLREIMVDLYKYVEDRPQTEERDKRWGLVSEALGAQFGKDRQLDDSLREYFKNQSNDRMPWDEVWQSTPT